MLLWGRISIFDFEKPHAHGRLMFGAPTLSVLKRGQKMEEKKFNSFLDDFLAYLRDNRACSENTVTNYAVDLAQYADFMESQGVGVSDITPHAIRAFLRSLSGFGYAASSVARKLSAVKAFELYLMEQKAIKADPAASVRGPRLAERLPRAVSREAMNDLIAAAWTIEPCLRNGTILEVLYASGLRVAELVSLKWNDIELEPRWITVTGKGDKQRRVPFGRPRQEALQRWQSVSPHDPECYVFPGKNGGSITVRTIHRLVVQAARNVGLEEVTPHSIRHSYATHMLEGGASLNVLQELLGHESLLSTQRYLKITPGHLRESYMAAHPRSGEGE